MTNGVPNYLPGLEPENIKKLLNTFFSEIDKSFPDKTIVWSEWNHEKLDKPAGYLCKYLGYSRGTDFLNAYGYSVVMERDNRSTERSHKPHVSEREAAGSKRAKEKAKRKTGKLILSCVVGLAIIIVGIFAVSKIFGVFPLGGSSAVKDFDKQVDIVSNQTEVSESDISYLEKAYNALSPSDKAEVKNYEKYLTILTNYEVKIYDAKIETAVVNQNLGEMQGLLKEINNLEPTIKSNIKNYSELENSLTVAAYNTILSYKNAKVDEMYKLIVEFKDSFSDEQLKTAMLNYAKWNGYNGAEEYIKSALKSPRSFNMYDGTVSGFTEDSTFEDGSYKGMYTIEYGATNSFGGEVTTTTAVITKAYIDFENLSVKYTYIGEYGTKSA